MMATERSGNVRLVNLIYGRGPPPKIEVIFTGGPLKRPVSVNVAKRTRKPIQPRNQVTLYNKMKP